MGAGQCVTCTYWLDWLKDLSLEFLGQASSEQPSQTSLIRQKHYNPCLIASTGQFLRAALLFYNVSWCLVKCPSCIEYMSGRVSLADEISHNFAAAVINLVLTMFSLPLSHAAFL